MNGLFWQGFIALALLTPFAFWVEDFRATYNLNFLFSVVWLAVIVSMAAYGLMIYLIRTRTASRVSALQYFTPPVTMIIAFMVFGEQQSSYGYAGLLVVGIGCVLFHYGEGKKKKNKNREYQQMTRTPSGVRRR